MADQTTTIPKGWKMITLGEVAEKIVDNRGKTPPVIGSGFELLEVNTISENQRTPDYSRVTKFVDEDTFKNWFRTGVILENDILIPTVGTIGNVSFSKITRGAIAQNLIALRTDTKISEPLFIYYLLKNPSSKNKLLNLDIGGVQPSIKVPHLLAMETAVPPLSEQHAIAAVLSSLDDKIELLREQNKTLEGTAQAIFKEWFVNFNFPGATGKMIDSELGEIPEGWRFGKLGDAIEIFDSKRVPLASDVRAKRKGKFPYYGATSIMDYIDDYLFDGTYLLLAEDGSVMDKNGYPVLQYVWDKFWVSNHSHVLQGKNGFTTEILYVLLKETNITGIVNGAVQLKINQANLVNFEILVPARDILGKFDSLIQPIFGKTKNIQQQIQTLSTLRDALLPKLMKGEVRVAGFNN